MPLTSEGSPVWVKSLSGELSTQTSPLFTGPEPPAPHSSLLLTVLSQQSKPPSDNPHRVAPNCLLPESGRLGYTPVRIPMAMQLILWDKVFAISLSRSSTCFYPYNCRCLQVISTLSNAHWAATDHSVWQHQGQCWATLLYSGCELNAISVTSSTFMERTWITRRLPEAPLCFLDAKNVTGHLGTAPASAWLWGAPGHTAAWESAGTPRSPCDLPPSRQLTRPLASWLSWQSLLLLSTQVRLQKYY